MLPLFPVRRTSNDPAVRRVAEDLMVQLLAASGPAGVDAERIRRKIAAALHREMNCTLASSAFAAVRRHGPFQLRVRVPCSLSAVCALTAVQGSRIVYMPHLDRDPARRCRHLPPPDDDAPKENLPLVAGDPPKSPSRPALRRLRELILPPFARISHPFRTLVMCCPRTRTVPCLYFSHPHCIPLYPACTSLASQCTLLVLL